MAMAKNGVEAAVQAIRYYPDVAVMDISMPVMDGTEATRQIRAGSPMTRVLILSLYEFPVFIKVAFRAGNAKSASKRLAHFPSPFVLRFLLDELEISLVLSAVLQPDIELAAGAGPGFVSLP